MAEPAVISIGNHIAIKLLLLQAVVLEQRHSAQNLACFGNPNNRTTGTDNGGASFRTLA